MTFLLNIFVYEMFISFDSQIIRYNITWKVICLNKDQAHISFIFYYKRSIEIEFNQLSFRCGDLLHRERDTYMG